MGRMWKDYYFEMRAYFEGWLNELEIGSFDGLLKLMITDQMKKRCSPECKEHYLDIWEELISPEMLADKLEAFDNIWRSLPSGPRRYVKASETVIDERQVSFRKPERPPKREYSNQVPNERSFLRCYGCGKQGVIKSRYPTCNLNASQRTDVATKHINAYSAQTRSPRFTLIHITFCGIKGRVCADTGSSHSIVGERMFQIFKDKGLLFQETTLAMSLADGEQTTGFLVEDKHDCWSEKLPFIRFALNTAKCETTGQTAAFLNFSRELRSPSEVVNDIRVIIQKDNFVPEITPYLKKFATFSTQIREVVEEQQDSRKFYADKKRRAAPTYQPGEHVFVASHPLSNAVQGKSAKLMPRRDGPYVILTKST
ncbi:uncharacterized protein TNCV_1820381 [Trichonephila clavipes]|nr:uncharacterized protein TNCV_1820381 [Trichonephila clavipes]